MSTTPDDCTTPADGTAPAEGAASAEGMTPADWAARYQADDTPWDLGGPHPELARLLEAGDLAPSAGRDRALVPGCGNGHDARALAAAGWRVTALDCVRGVDAALASDLAASGGELRITDALAFDGEGAFDLVWDHTFFCAIDPTARERWGGMVRRSLAQDGTVVALVFPGDKPVEEGGPPHAFDVVAMGEALGATFELLHSAPVERGVERRTWSESVARYQRAAADEPDAPQAGRS